MSTILGHAISGANQTLGDSWLVDVYTTGFVVNMSTSVIPINNPEDDSLFWDDDTLSGAKGLIFEKKDFESDSPIAVHEWIVTAPFIVGANAVAGVSGTTGDKVFIRTHGADGTTPLSTSFFAHNLDVTLESGASGLGNTVFGFSVSASPSGAPRALSGYLSGKSKPAQGANPTEVIYSFEAYQQNVAEAFETSHIILNADPTNAAFTLMLHDDPCGTIFEFPVSPTSWNTGGIITPCDQGDVYTFASAQSLGQILSIGSDTTGTYPTQTIGQAIFSFN